MAPLKVDTVMRRLKGWMRDDGLSLALSETKCLVLARKDILTIIALSRSSLQRRFDPLLTKLPEK